jgi:hypothetical protein
MRGSPPRVVLVRAGAADSALQETCSAASRRPSWTSSLKGTAASDHLRPCDHCSRVRRPADPAARPGPRRRPRRPLPRRALRGRRPHPPRDPLPARRGGQPTGRLLRPPALPAAGHGGRTQAHVRHPRGPGAKALPLACWPDAERTATTLGHTEMRLETAVHQPEAIALYTRAGYTPIPNYPPYQHKTLSRCYAKPMPHS